VRSPEGHWRVEGVGDVTVYTGRDARVHRSGDTVAELG